MECITCGLKLGSAERLERLVSEAGRSTPTKCGLDPEHVLWICGSHLNETGVWPLDVPYWLKA